MKTKILAAFLPFLTLAACAVDTACPASPELCPAAFKAPPADMRPWCYWWWQNGHADEQSITSDLEEMAKLGFGGFLLSDSRGYWDDDNHVIVPKAEIEVMSPRWRALVQHALREARRLGLKASFNTATSGGKLCGPWKVGPDAPKRLMCRVYPQGAAFEKPDFPYWQDIASFTVTAPADKVRAYVDRGWYEAGDGTKTQLAETKNDRGLSSWIPVDEKGATYVVRFGSTTVPDHDYDVDVLDPDAIRAHFNRFTGAIMDEAGPEMVGTNKTVYGIYSVSWEGVVPMWSKNFASDFRKYAGYDFKETLPVLAGFAPRGVDPQKVLNDCRRARNGMFCDNFYGTLKELAAARGCIMFSENGGPWHRDPEIFREADQLAFYALNDMPQGEFWQNEQGLSTRQFAENDLTDRFFTRGAVSAGHVYGKPRISMESFTHMRRHWSMSPSVLRTPIDKAFADGANFVVWHTYSLSPAKFGVPGCEYFAGTHINGNVTWHDEAKGFLTYLARCQYLLSRGEPVVDIAVKAGPTPYADWGRYRAGVDGYGEKIPAGYNYDLVDDAAWATSEVEDGYRVFPSGMKYPVTRPAQPDLEGPFTFCHRRVGAQDIYFLQGFAKGRAIFRPEGQLGGRNAEIWDAVTGEIKTVEANHLADGRYALDLDLTETGSTFVVLSCESIFKRPAPPPPGYETRTVDTPWDVSFAYHKLDHTRHLPKPRKMAQLTDWTTSDDPDLKYFSGTATYETTLHLDLENALNPEPSVLSLGALPTGVAHVWVNGVDCGSVWCAPWTVTVPGGAIRHTTKIVVKYTNNWTNRLIGDCDLAPEDRVTTSCLQLQKGGRTKPNGKSLNVYSGYCSEDALQKSGLLGPVKIVTPRKPVEARKAPAWFESGVIYQMSLRTLTRGGTFAAAAEMLEHVKNTGANIVYLTPFVEMDRDMDRAGWSPRQIKSGYETPKNPYRISNYDAVDPEYGTEADLKAFVDKAHGLGLKVMFDLVYLHAGPNNVIARQIPDAFQKNPDGSVRMTVWRFPYINFASADARAYLKRNMRRFVQEFDVDGFRCDVGDQVPEEFWNEAFAEIRRIKPDFATLNEGRLPSHVQRAFNANYDWNWSYAMREAVQDKPGHCPLARRIAWETDYRAKCPETALTAVFLENHDLATDSWKDRIDSQLPVEAVNAAYAGLFLARTVPVIWNGNEIADGSKTSFFGPVEHPARIAETVNWEKAVQPAAKKRLAVLRELARLRRENPAIGFGTMTFVPNDRPERVLTFVREVPGTRCLVAVNLSPEASEVTVEGRRLELPAWGWKVLP